MPAHEAIFSVLADLAAQSADHSYVPYSGRKEGCVILLEDGSVVHGCRVENASFQLTIGALINAWSTLHAIGRLDVAAVVQNRPFTPSEKVWLDQMPEFDWHYPSAAVALPDDHLPEPSESLQPIMEDWGTDPMDGASTARLVAEWAHTPQSDFPVGCVVKTDAGYHLPGVNVEHPDWAHIICAERNALSTAVAYGYGSATDIFVSCIKDPGGTPCGACRQVIVELAPEATVWMDRIDQPPVPMKASELLPGSFTGQSLRRHGI